MARCSSILVSLLNVVTLFVSVAAIGAAFYAHVHKASDCQRALQTPLLTVGAFLLVVSLMGLIGSACRVTWMLWLYLLVMFLLVAGLVCFTVLALIVTHKGVGKFVSGKGFYEYRSGDYSSWLQNHVVNGKHWDSIKSCLIDARVCGAIHAGNAAEFNHSFLSPAQSGCCKPPTHCRYKYVNATFWEIPPSGPEVDDGDCRTWSNNQKELCYECSSCKGGILENIKSQWRRLAIFNICLLVLLIIIYSIGCCALSGNRHDVKYKRHRNYPCP